MNDDPRHPFDAERFLEGFSVDERVIHAADDPVLDGLARVAREAWAAFLAVDDHEAS